jgi:DNA-binding LacI/PurR family transcriptional regulator
MATKRSAAGSAGGKRITIRDVADAAGVSIATVSFVMNRRVEQTISPPVRERVLQAAERLGYAPSAMAVGLARKRTRNVTIVFYRNEQQITNPFYSFTIQGAIKEATGRGYNILFSFLPQEYLGPHDLPLAVREKNTEGALFIQNVDERLIRDVLARGIAVAAVDSHARIAELPSFHVDNVRGARLACEHLIDLGHKDICFLYGDGHRPSIDERRRGFLAALGARGLPDDARCLVDAGRLTFEAAYETAGRLLETRPGPGAIFCANDEMAAGVLRAARQRGIEVPRDLSVVGFDDIIMSAYVDPPLTTVGFDKEAMGRAAMQCLLDRLEKREHPAAPHLLAPELVVRGSSLPPAPAVVPPRP